MNLPKCERYSPWIHHIACSCVRILVISHSTISSYGIAASCLVLRPNVLYIALVNTRIMQVEWIFSRYLRMMRSRPPSVEIVIEAGVFTRS